MLSRFHKIEYQAKLALKGLDYERMLKEWPSITAGIRGMVEFLEEESVFDEERLPSYTPIPLIAAIWRLLPTQPDQLGNVRLLLRQYLWRAFLTARYEQSSPTRSFQDFRSLQSVLRGSGAVSDVPIFDETIYPIPTAELIAQADWPKKKTIIGRGLLALQMKAGAVDLADGKPAS